MIMNIVCRGFKALHTHAHTHARTHTHTHTLSHTHTQVYTNTSHTHTLLNFIYICRCFIQYFNMMFTMNIEQD
jgi:hypothetical protein